MRASFAPRLFRKGGAPDAARARALKLDPTLHLVPILRTTDTQNASLPRARAIEPAPALRSYFHPAVFGARGSGTFTLSGSLSSGGGPRVSTLAF